MKADVLMQHLKDRIHSVGCTVGALHSIFFEFFGEVIVPLTGSTTFLVWLVSGATIRPNFSMKLRNNRKIPRKVRSLVRSFDTYQWRSISWRSRRMLTPPTPSWRPIILLFFVIITHLDLPTYNYCSCSLEQTVWIWNRCTLWESLYMSMSSRYTTIKT